MKIRLLVLLILVPGGLAQQPPVSASRATFRITGVVVSSTTGQALAETHVRIGVAPQFNSSQVLLTAADGHFHFEGLAPGKYWLAADRTGYSHQRYQQHEGFFTGIAVGPGLESENLVFRMLADASISGQITDEQEEPVRNVQVMLLQNRLLAGQQTTTSTSQAMSDDRGMYHFGHLAPGSYFVVVAGGRPWYAQYFPQRTSESGVYGAKADPPEMDLTYPTLYYPGVSDSSAASPIQLKPGEGVNADFHLTPESSIVVRVKAAALDPRQGINLMLMPKAFHGVEIGVAPTQMMSNKPGEADLIGVAPGEYTLRVQTFGKHPMSREQFVDLESDTEINLDETGNTPTSISGMAKLEGSENFPSGAVINFSSRESGQFFQSSISGKGEFRLQDQTLPPGRYDISFFNLPNTVIQAIKASGAEVVGRSIELKPASTVELAILLSQGVGEVRGTAISETDGKPVSGAMMVLLPDDPGHNASLIRRDQSDSDGTFTLPNVAPGRYSLLALRDGWALEWMRPEVLQPYLRRSESVVVAAGGKYDLKVKAQ